MTRTSGSLGGSGSTGSAPYAEVVDYASLPAAASHSGEIYVVQTTTGIIGFRKLAGLWRSDGASWNYLGLYGRNAAEITNVPAGTIASTDVQAAINELDSDVQAHIGTGGFAHADVVASGASGFMTGSDKAKLDAISGTNTGDQTITLTGNVTGSGTGSFAATIANDAVTFAKMQNSSAASVLIGRGAGSGAGDFQEITLGTNLSLSGTVLNALGGSGSGDFVGPASSTDNAIVRFDSTTGKLGQDSAATVSDDGVIRSATNSGANAVSVPLVNWCMLTADYVLTSSVAEQKLFNTTTNGTLTLPTGVYYFEYWLYLLTMSATSGNAAIDPIGAGTAVTDRWGQYASGIDNSAALNAGTQTGSGAVTQQTVASVVSAGTGQGMMVKGTGMFRISTGGTIIPSITLVTAAAATVKAGSWFRIEKIGESSETTLGNWS